MVSVVVVRDIEQVHTSENENENEKERVIRERSHFVLEISNVNVLLGPLDIAI